MSTELGDRIRNLRQLRGLTPKALARAAGVTREWLSRVERGVITDPEPIAIDRVAAALGVPHAELLPGRHAGGRSVAIEQDIEERNADLIRDLVIEVLAHGNLAVAEHVLAPTYTIHGPFPDTAISRPRLMRALVDLRRALPDLTVTIDELIASGETVVVRWTLNGTHTGAVGDVPATGSVIGHAGMAMFRVVDGQVTESWMSAESTDAALLRRLGLQPSSHAQPPAPDAAHTRR